MDDPSQNFFAVLTLIAAPAVLTNACSVLALNTANRFGRVVDRSRQLAQELEGIRASGSRDDPRLRQLSRLRLRAQYLMRAQSFIYLALGLFVAAALVSVIGTLLAMRFPATYEIIGLIGLCVGVGASASVVYGCSLLVRETRVALVHLREEVIAFEEPPPAKPNR